jgi:hypothetical protein
MGKQEDSDAHIGVTVADDVRPQHSSEVKQADVSSWSCRSTCCKVYNYALAQWVSVSRLGGAPFTAAGCCINCVVGWQQHAAQSSSCNRHPHQQQANINEDNVKFCTALQHVHCDAATSTLVLS